jgi:hypothetical protein
MEKSKSKGPEIVKGEQKEPGADGSRFQSGPRGDGEANGEDVGADREGDESALNRPLLNCSGATRNDMRPPKWGSGGCSRVGERSRFKTLAV